VQAFPIFYNISNSILKFIEGFNQQIEGFNARVGKAECNENIVLDVIMKVGIFELTWIGIVRLETLWVYLFQVIDKLIEI